MQVEVFLLQESLTNDIEIVFQKRVCHLFCCIVGHYFKNIGLLGILVLRDNQEAREHNISNDHSVEVDFMNRNGLSVK